MPTKYSIVKSATRKEMQKIFDAWLTRACHGETTYLVLESFRTSDGYAAMHAKEITAVQQSLTFCLPPEMT